MIGMAIMAIGIASALAGQIPKEWISRNIAETLDPDDDRF